MSKIIFLEKFKFCGLLSRLLLNEDYYRFNCIYTRCAEAFCERRQHCSKQIFLSRAVIIVSPKFYKPAPFSDFDHCRPPCWSSNNKSFKRVPGMQCNSLSLNVTPSLWHNQKQSLWQCDKLLCDNDSFLMQCNCHVSLQTLQDHNHWDKITASCCKTIIWPFYTIILSCFTKVNFKFVLNVSSTHDFSIKPLVHWFGAYATNQKFQECMLVWFLGKTNQCFLALDWTVPSMITFTQPWTMN